MLLDVPYLVPLPAPTRPPRPPEPTTLTVRERDRGGAKTAAIAGCDRGRGGRRRGDAGEGVLPLQEERSDDGGLVLRLPWEEGRAERGQRVSMKRATPTMDVSDRPGEELRDEEVRPLGGEARQEGSLGARVDEDPRAANHGDARRRAIAHVPRRGLNPLDVAEEVERLTWFEEALFHEAHLSRTGRAVRQGVEERVREAGPHHGPDGADVDVRLREVEEPFARGVVDAREIGRGDIVLRHDFAVRSLPAARTAGCRHVLARPRNRLRVDGGVRARLAAQRAGADGGVALHPDGELDGAAAHVGQRDGGRVANRGARVDERAAAPANGERAHEPERQRCGGDRVAVAADRDSVELGHSAADSVRHERHRRDGEPPHDGPLARRETNGSAPRSAAAREGCSGPRPQ